MAEGKQSFGFDAPAADMIRWKQQAQKSGVPFGQHVRDALASYELRGKCTHEPMKASGVTPEQGSATVRVPGEAAAAAGDPGRSSEPRKGLKRSRPSAEPCKHPRHGMKGWKCPGCREMF